jgi:hypothetical protein
MVYWSQPYEPRIRTHLKASENIATGVRDDEVQWMLGRSWIGADVAVVGTRHEWRWPTTRRYEVIGIGFRKGAYDVDPVKTSPGMPHGWHTAEQPTLGDDQEVSESDEFSEEFCEATIVRLDSPALEALFQKARS